MFVPPPKRRAFLLRAAAGCGFNGTEVSTSIRIKDLPDSERPRERLVANGADALSNSELIAILLRTGLKGTSAIDVAKQLLQKFNTLDNLSRASLEDLRQIKGIGRDKAIALKSAFTLARRMAQEIRAEGPALDNPDAVANLLREDNRWSTWRIFRW